MSLIVSCIQQVCAEGQTLFSTLEIHFLFFTPQEGAEKSMNEFREGTYPPQKGGLNKVPP
jgi:hypothetical protein